MKYYVALHFTSFQPIQSYSIPFNSVCDSFFTLLCFILRWHNGELTNFAYLTELNKQACRSFNDLMQYPVFPLVLAEYKCDVLDLTDVSVYR